MAEVSRTKASARELVVATLRDRIISSELPPGAPLAEKDIASELGVSRTPVREGVIILAEEGLVQVYPQLGTFVTRISLQRVAHSQFVREALESASLMEAFEKVKDDDIVDLKTLLAEQDSAVRSADRNAFLRLDDEFHRRLMEVAGRESAWREVSVAKRHMDRARRLSLPLPNVLERLLQEHRGIVQGLAEHDNVLGLDTLRKHLRGVFDDIADIKGLKPELFSDTDITRPVRRVTTTWTS